MTVVASNIIAVVVNVLESYVLGNTALFLCVAVEKTCSICADNIDRFRYGMPYHGLMGLQVGFLVAFTQLIPEHQVQIFGGLAKMRVKVRSIGPAHSLTLADTPPAVSAHALRHLLERPLLIGLPIALHPHPVWLARRVVLPALHQV